MTFPFKLTGEDRARPSRRSVRPLSFGATMLMAWASSTVIAQTSSTMPLRRVLVLYSDERLLPANIIVDEAIRATFAVESSNRIEFHSEFLDVSRFPGEAQQQRERDFLRDKYRERPPDLVIAGGGPALEFLLKYRAVLFADVPIVHCAVGGSAEGDAGRKDRGDSDAPNCRLHLGAGSQPAAGHPQCCGGSRQRTPGFEISRAISGRDSHFRGPRWLHLADQPVTAGFAR